MKYPWASAAAPLPVMQHHERRIWLRCSRHRPCPICGRPDWCSVSEDGAAAMCMRISEGSCQTVGMGHGTGYIHEIAGDHTPLPSYTAPIRCKPMQLDCEAILARWQAASYPGQAGLLAMDLGVSEESLTRLGAVWSQKYDAWAFPMFDARRRVVGIRLRNDRADKWAVRRSDVGLFLPTGLNIRSKLPLLICEGPTDTAAGLTLGYHAIGRPSNSGGVELICEILESGRQRDVVVVADHDKPGQYGAAMLARRILGIALTVRVITPPAKDIRRWLNQGAGQGDVQGLINATNYFTGAAA